MPAAEPAGRAVPAPAARYESYSHQALLDDVERGNDPVDAGQVAAGWAGLAGRLSDSTAVLSALIAGTHERWEGPAGDALRDVLGHAARWTAHSAAASESLGTAVSGQADVAARARADMPPVVDYDPAGMIRGAAAGGSLFALAGLAAAMATRRDAAEAARQKAIDVVNTRDAGLRSLAATDGFASPPSLGGTA